MYLRSTELLPYSVRTLSACMCVFILCDAVSPSSMLASIFPSAYHSLANVGEAVQVVLSLAVGFQNNLASNCRNLPVSSRASTALNATLCPLGHGDASGRAVNGSGSIWPYQVFKSATFNPPQLQVTRNGKQLAPGFVFFDPSHFTALIATQDQAPLIMTDGGQLVWNGPYLHATNFRVASYQGEAILTFWSGFNTPADADIRLGFGNITFLDSSYTEILTVCPKLGLVTATNTTYECEADLHESYLTDRNTLLITAYNATPTDLRSIGGPKEGWVYDSLFLEISPKDGSILFRWSSLEHVPVSESKKPLGSVGRNQSQPFDYFHINSVVNVGNDYLVNSRKVWSTYLVSATGNIIWTIKGDTGGDFGPLPHHGQFVSKHLISSLYSRILISRSKSPGNTMQSPTPLPTTPSLSAGSITTMTPATTAPNSPRASNSSSPSPLRPTAPPLFAPSDTSRIPRNLFVPQHRAHSPSSPAATSSWATAKLPS